MRTFERASARWDRNAASIRETGGPQRVVTDDPAPDFTPRPVGFTAQIEPVEAEPLRWEGDDS